MLRKQVYRARHVLFSHGEYWLAWVPPLVCVLLFLVAFHTMEDFLAASWAFWLPLVIILVAYAYNRVFPIEPLN